MITDAQVEKALDWLRDNAEEAAVARAQRLVVEEYLKVIKAKIMKEHAELGVSAQEREACADTRYAAHLEAIREAVRADEKFRFMREAANAKIESWRTFSSNKRAGNI